LRVIFGGALNFIIRRMCVGAFRLCLSKTPKCLNSQELYFFPNSIFRCVFLWSPWLHPKPWSDGIAIWLPLAFDVGFNIPTCGRPEAGE
jgi:hypothetical protein